MRVVGLAIEVVGKICHFIGFVGLGYWIVLLLHRPETHYLVYVF